MKFLGLTLSAFMFAAMPLSAQSPPAPAAAVPKTDRVEMILRAWESRMSGLESFSTRVKRTEVNPLTKRSVTMVGEAAFMKPNLARLNLTPPEDLDKKDTEKGTFERIFCNGNYIYEYSPKEKLIIVHELPRNGNTDENMILSFLRGMKAANAKDRFDITLTKEDQWYGYLLIAPKHPADKQEFQAAQLTIWMNNPNQPGQANIAMMPVRLWYRQPNGKEVTYDFADMQPDAKLDKESFVPRRIQGFEVKNAATQVNAPPERKSSTVRE